MNASTSEYSSGCESGWTMYLDQISNSDAYSRDLYQQKGGGYDDEDQSMLSDASSGPPAYEPHQDTKTKTKSKTNTYRKEANQNKQQPLCLDDTASSSIFHFDHLQGNVPRSHDSAAHFEGESVTKKRLSFFKSSTNGKSGSVVGRKRQ